MKNLNETSSKIKRVIDLYKRTIVIFNEIQTFCTYYCSLATEVDKTTNMLAMCDTEMIWAKVNLLTIIDGLLRYIPKKGVFVIPDSTLVSFNSQLLDLKSALEDKIPVGTKPLHEFSEENLCLLTNMSRLTQELLSKSLSLIEDTDILSGQKDMFDRYTVNTIKNVDKVEELLATI